MSDERQPWERMEGETPKAYEAFCCYKDLGVERTVIAAYSVYKGGVPGDIQGRPPGFFRTWSERFDWPERAQSFDDAARKRDLEATQKEREEVVILAWKALKLGIMGQLFDLGLTDLEPDVRNRTVNSLRATLAQLGFAQVVDDTPSEIQLTYTLVAPPEDEDEPE